MRAAITDTKSPLFLVEGEVINVDKKNHKSRLKLDNGKKIWVNDFYLAEKHDGSITMGAEMRVDKFDKPRPSDLG